MTDREMQIDSLANALYNKQDEFDMSNPFEVANCVINLGYRKIPEGSVVLTREEHMAMLKDCAESNRITSQLYYERGSKETAREFAGKIQDYLNDKVCEEFGDNACDVTYFTIDVDKVISDVFEIAEQFGVEVE